MLSLAQLPAHAILGLESFADGDAIRRKANAIAMRARLAGDSEGHAEAARRAAELLTDPQEWLRDSLRWLALPAGSLERAGYDLQAACSNPTRAVEAALKFQSAESATHNECVVRVLQAMTVGGVGDACRAVSLVAEALAGFGAPTPRARTAAHLVAGAGWVWGVAEAAVARRADPRLNDEVLRTICDEYALSVLKPLLEWARGQLAVGRIGEIKSLLSACAAVEAVVGSSAVLRDVLLGPLLERSELSIGEFEKRIGDTKSERALVALAAEARARLDADLELIVGCGELGGAHATRVRDAYAEFLRMCAIRGCNEFKAFSAAESMLTRAKAVAGSSALQSQITDDLKQAAELLTFRRCAYCRASVADGRPAEVPMFRITARNLGSVSYQSLTATVPRCRACAQKQGERDQFSRFFAAGCAGIGLIVGIAVASSGGRSDGGDICCGLGIGTVVGFIAGSVLGRFVQWRMSLGDAGSPRDFAPIAKLVGEGWKFGEKPGKYD